MSNYFDDFNRADNLDLGTNWTVIAVGEGNAQIVGGRVRDFLADGIDSREVHSGVLLDNQFTQITLASTSGTTPRGITAVLRANTGGVFTCYGMQAQFNAVDLLTSRLFKVVSGVATVLASESATTWVAGDLLKGIAIDASLVLQRNNSNLLTATDSAILTGNAGIFIFVDPGGTTGDIELDDFQSGDILFNVNLSTNYTWPAIASG